MGTELGTTEWLTITQQAVDAFADITRDRQWIHIDVDRARHSTLGGTIVHGHFLLSLLPSFAADLYTITAGSARLNYGLEKTRFPASAPVGSQIRATATLESVQATASGTRVEVAWRIRAFDVTKPVCVANTITTVIS